MEPWKWIAEREATEILADDELVVKVDELVVKTDDELVVKVDSSEIDIHSMEVETKDYSSAVETKDYSSAVETKDCSSAVETSKTLLLYLATALRLLDLQAMICTTEKEVDEVEMQVELTFLEFLQLLVRSVAG